MATPDGWSAGRSSIRPYAHTALHAAIHVSRRRTVVIVRERNRGNPQPGGDFDGRLCTERELDAVLAEAREWSQDFLELLITRREGEADVRLRCGRWGTAPVYLLERGGVLRVDWDATRLYPHLSSSRLEPGFAAQYLFDLDYPYSRRTIFPGMWMLTERAEASWRPSSPQGLKLKYPRAEAWASASRLKRNARVEETFREILAASMRRWLPPADSPVALELSGGLDSSTVAATAADIAEGAVLSYGMLMPGVLGGHQQARRAEVARRFGLVDRTLPCIDHPPFSPKSRRVSDLKIVPWSEFYEEAVGTMLRWAKSDGAHVIFTGMGGDELCSYQRGELGRLSRTRAAGGGGNDESSHAAEPDEDSLDDGDSSYPPFATDLGMDAYEDRDALIDDAPQSLMYTSALESAAAVSRLYMDVGVWPVSPLCTPELVEFCRRLPFEWRHERIIQRKVLASHGCSPLVAYPKPETLENFCDVMAFALGEASSGVINKLFRNSRLAEQGLVDRDKLMTAYAQLRRGDTRYSDQILGAVVLELTVRSVEQHLDAPVIEKTAAPPKAPRRSNAQNDSLT
jgi:asparagine synthase (glutamine-hydrolysing)